MLILDFKEDWKTCIITKMTILGFIYNQSKSLEDNTMHYFNIKRRIISKKIRRIHESKELKIPEQYKKAYSAIKECFSNGGDLMPYLSRKMKQAEYKDLLLNEWGITHLHFSPQGTKEVIFVMINDTDVFIIQVFPHGHGFPYSWVNTQLIEILHNNWPEIIADYKTKISGEDLTRDQRKNIRYKQSLNTIITVSDGTNYLPPGGGFVSCGYCIKDRIKTDELMKNLAEWEHLVRMNESNFRTALNIASDEKLSIKIKFDGQECYFFVRAE